MIEFGRLLFTWNTLTEATRRGARMAAVCPPPTPLSTGDINAIKCAAIFNTLDNLSNCSNACTSSTASPILPGLTADNVVVDYLKSNGTSPAANFGEISYVRLSIKNYQLPLSIPFFDLKPWAPEFQTTLPSESLGIIPGS